MGIEFLEDPRRYLFFTGKGGVGKTSLACASAVTLAERGLRVLLVSTDPASNLDAVLGVSLNNRPRDIPGVPGLMAMNINPEEAAREYRERTVAPYRGVLPESELVLLQERLSGACTVEIAAFDEFTLLIAGDAGIGTFDHIIFDTAPTGHTLRLLQLPAAWTGFLEASDNGESCLGPLSGLKAQQSRYAKAVAALADPYQTLLVLVTRPEHVALLEAARTSVELGALNMKNQFLVINSVFHAEDRNDPLAVAYEKRGQKALETVPPELSALPRAEVSLRAYNIVGTEVLRRLLGSPADIVSGALTSSPSITPAETNELASLINELASSDHGLVMVMGKGGVGKTTIAAAIAVGLAHRGRSVHLSTTDPAQHLKETLPSEVPGLRVSWIDPIAEARRYREDTLTTKGKHLDAAGRALLEEELRSPCYDEIAVFQAFSRIVSEARHGFVVLDTAPTGHTLLLLDATGAYHRQITHDLTAIHVKFVTPLMRLQDPDYTKVIIVTLPETTPVLEAKALQDDLHRASIKPFAWVINASLAVAQPRDPVLAERAAAEWEQIHKVHDEFAHRLAVVPFLAEEPVGVKRLLEIAGR